MRHVDFTPRRFDGSSNVIRRVLTIFDGVRQQRSVTLNGECSCDMLGNVRICFEL